MPNIYHTKQACLPLTVNAANVSSVDKKRPCFRGYIKGKCA